MSPGSKWTIRRLDDSQLDAYASIAGESLLGTSRPGWDSYFDRVGRENLRGVFSRDSFVGGLGFYRMGQWFGGQCLTAAGISGVAISPSLRGQGAAHALLSAVLNELRAEGIPLATLFASTQRLYRSVGFEQAGTRLQYRLPLRSIPADNIVAGGPPDDDPRSRAAPANRSRAGSTRAGQSGSKRGALATIVRAE